MGKYAIINGIILDGNKDMEPKEGTILVNGEKIEKIVLVHLFLWRP